MLHIRKTALNLIPFVDSQYLVSVCYLRVLFLSDQGSTLPHLLVIRSIYTLGTPLAPTLIIFFQTLCIFFLLVVDTYGCSLYMCLPLRKLVSIGAQ